MSIGKKSGHGLQQFRRKKKKSKSYQRKFDEHRKYEQMGKQEQRQKKKDATGKKVDGRAVAKGTKDQIHRRKNKATKGKKTNNLKPKVKMFVNENSQSKRRLHSTLLDEDDKDSND